jgi:hypothetical protein
VNIPSCKSNFRQASWPSAKPSSNDMAAPWFPFLAPQRRGVLICPVLESELSLSGNGAAWLERKDLISRFWEFLPGVPIVALLRSGDALFNEADSNCLADNPPLGSKP